MPGFNVRITDQLPGNTQPNDETFQFAPNYLLSDVKDVNRNHRWVVTKLGPINSNQLRSSAEPYIICESFKLPVLNYEDIKVMGTYIEYKFPNKAIYEPASLSLYDTFGLHDQLTSLWLNKTSGYRKTGNLTEVIGGIGAYDEYKKEDVEVKLIDGAGRVTRVYILKNAWIKDITHSDLVYSNSELKLLNITLSYDWFNIVEFNRNEENKSINTDREGRKNQFTKELEDAKSSKSGADGAERKPHSDDFEGQEFVESKPYSNGKAFSDPPLRLYTGSARSLSSFNLNVGVTLGPGGVSLTGGLRARTPYGSINSRYTYSNNGRSSSSSASINGVVSGPGNTVAGINAAYNNNNYNGASSSSLNVSGFASNGVSSGRFGFNSGRYKYSNIPNRNLTNTSKTVSSNPQLSSFSSGSNFSAYKFSNSSTEAFSDPIERDYVGDISESDARPKQYSSGGAQSNPSLNSFSK